MAHEELQKSRDFSNIRSRRLTLFALTLLLLLHYFTSPKLDGCWKRASRKAWQGATSCSPLRGFNHCWEGASAMLTRARQFPRPYCISSSLPCWQLLLFHPLELAAFFWLNSLSTEKLNFWPIKNICKFGSNLMNSFGQKRFQDSQTIPWWLFQLFISKRCSISNLRFIFKTRVHTPGNKMKDVGKKTFRIKSNHLLYPNFCSTCNLKFFQFSFQREKQNKTSKTICFSGFFS